MEKNMAEEHKTNNKKKIKAVAKKDPTIGIDTKNKSVDDLLFAASTQSLDIGALENFLTISQTREQIYQTIDTMSQDSVLASVIETYAEDATQMNDDGRIFWVESDDENCAKLITYYLDSLNVDKEAFNYAVSLIKYGDLYLKLFRNSEYEESSSLDLPEVSSENHRSLLTEALEANLNDSLDDDALKEDVNVVINEDNDHYALFVEQVANPGEMFELTKLGETRMYIKAPASVQTTLTSQSATSYNSLRYRINKNDVTVYPADSFVHAYLTNAVSRDPERVTLFIDDDANKTKEEEFTVRRGSSILSDVFKVWRELSLLENSVLLNRLTKSSIIRLYQVEVGDMPKNKVQLTLSKVKELIEQKTAINTGKSMQEYTNPGPLENSIIFPVHEGKGGISQTVVGGDVDPKQLTDLDWFNNKMFGALRIPKAYFSFTDDGAGFNGGESLAIQSSRYGKAVKRIQKALIECITDLINLLLLDKGQIRYINKFRIRMQAPLTQEERERRETNDNRIRYIGDVMQQLSDVQDPAARLKILKILLGSTLNNQEIMSIIQEEIDKVEAEGPKDESKPEETGDTDSSFIDDINNTDLDADIDEMPILGAESDQESENSEEPELSQPTEPESSIEPEPTEASQPEQDSYLPSPAELNQDMTKNA